jgi:hypothetical protein
MNSPKIGVSIVSALAALVACTSAFANDGCPRSPRAGSGPVEPGSLWPVVHARLREAPVDCTSQRGTAGTCTFRAFGITYELERNQLMTVRMPADGSVRLPFRVAPHATRQQTIRSLTVAGRNDRFDSFPRSFSVLCAPGDSERGMLTFSFDSRGRLLSVAESQSAGEG